LKIIYLFIYLLSLVSNPNNDANKIVMVK